MRFEVLGPVTVRTDDGTPVPVPEAKVRALLAALLVHHGRPVAADRLIDDLWGEGAPGNPANTLQTKVSQLRRALAGAEDGGRALVGFGPAGYTLRVSGEAVDAARFEELAARARAEDDVRARAGLLTRALGLWRGPAYGDVRDAAFVRASVARLEEQRVTVREELAEARLELGEHAALADELTALAGEHPLRQRLRAAQMRALYGAGRQGEALAVYGEVRARFAEELGIDPGPELGALYEAILRQDPLVRPAPPGAVVARPVSQPVSRLPAPVGSLIGREEAVTRVCAAVAAGRLVTLTGPGGVGKTRLALAAAARLEQEPAYPDGVWFVELAGVRGAVAGVVAAALGVREDADRGGGAGAGGEDAARERLAGALAPRGLLLVLDNCEHVADAVATLTGELLRRAPGLRVLATSQEPLALSGEVLEAVEPLPEADAVRLFAARAAAAAPGFALGPDNSGAVALVCRRLDGIPLALELAATRVRALGVHALADRLHDRFRLLNQVRRDAPARQRTLRAVIDWSWELLGPDERVVLRRLAVFSGGFTLESAEAVCAGGEIGAEQVLDLVARLVDCSLVAADGTARYRTLESVTAYALERLAEAGPAEASAARLRHAEHCAGLAERAAAHLHGPGQRRWLRRLDRETLNLRAALDHAAAAGAGGTAVRLVNALAWYWFLRGRIGEARDALDTALTCATGATGAAAAELAGARARRAAFATLAGAPQRISDRDTEHADARGLWLLEFARLGFATGGDGGGGGGEAHGAGGGRGGGGHAGHGHGHTGGVHGGGHDAGHAGSGHAGDGHAEDGHAGGVHDGGHGGDGHDNSGQGGHDGSGHAGDRHDDAGHGHDGVHGADGHDGSRHAGDGHGGGGDVLGRLVGVFREAGDRWGEAAALSGLATQALYCGDLARLRHYAEASAALFAELGDRWGQLQASEQLGVLAELAGDHPAAARLHREGEQGARELELWTQVSFRLARQGRIALLTGDTALAAELHERARQLAVEQSHRPAEQFAEIGLALGARRDGDLDAAEARLMPWLDWNRRLGVDSGAALILAQLGYVAELRGDAGRAEALHRDGLAAARRTGDPRALALAFEGLAGALSAAQAHPAAPAHPADPASPAARAAVLLGAAAALRESVGVPLPAAERVDVARAAARLRAALGEAAFAAAFSRGRGR
ncbi:BTAD domain-containing putative transcriptional regulator [Streptomyces goshikiensis]|uniref:BTAD domain-containing putative transcriptional regulator n=1 Tax=Streptomyces goshikiensis TaxID=1942 RepID=UPI0036C6D94B